MSRSVRRWHCRRASRSPLAVRIAITGKAGRQLRRCRRLSIWNTYLYQVMPTRLASIHIPPRHSCKNSHTPYTQCPRDITATTRRRLKMPPATSLPSCRHRRATTGITAGFLDTPITTWPDGKMKAARLRRQAVISASEHARTGLASYFADDFAGQLPEATAE